MRNGGRSWRALLAFVLVISVSGCSTIKGWFDSDEEDPRQPAELQDINETVKIRKKWSMSVGDGQGGGYYRLQPVLSNGRLYAASAKGHVVAVDSGSGKTLWRKKLKQSISGGVGVYENSLFLGTNDGAVLHLDARDGSLLWSRLLTGEVLSAPQSNGRIVAVQSYDGKLHGLDYNQGDILWTYDSNMPVLTLRGTGTPIMNGALVLAGFANGRVGAFDTQTGALSWEARVAISQGRSEIERIVDIDGSMELAGTTLYAASYQGNLVAIDINSGRKIWQEEASSWSGVSQGFGNAYIAEEDGTVRAFLRSGQGLRWQQDELAWRKLSRPTPVSSYVAVGDLEGYVHLLSQVDGSLVGRVKVDGDGIRGDMVADGNRLYVFGNGGKLVAFEVTAKN